MPHFTKKPIFVEAMQIAADRATAPGALLSPNTQTIAEVSGWMLGNGFRDFWVTDCDDAFGLTLKTLEGDMLASPGDWVIKEPFPQEGRLFYPCKREIFVASYDRVEAPGSYSLRPRTEGMEYFAITFGRTGIRDGYVVVEAYNEEIVRAWAFKEYGSLWSSVYALTDFLDNVAETGYRAVQLGRVETLHYEAASHV